MDRIIFESINYSLFAMLKHCLLIWFSLGFFCCGELSSLDASPSDDFSSFLFRITVGDSTDRVDCMCRQRSDMSLLTGVFGDDFFLAHVK